MKILLTIFCGIMALFGGGCALVLLPGLSSSSDLFSGSGIIAMPLAVLFFNMAALAAVWGWKKPWLPAFYILAVVDLLVALALLPIALSLSSVDKTLVPLGIGISLFFVIKALLLWRYASKIKAAAPAS